MQSSPHFHLICPCPQLMPLLKLQHAHISIYQELFIMWNSEVGQSRSRGRGHRGPPTPPIVTL